MPITPTKKRSRTDPSNGALSRQIIDLTNVSEEELTPKSKKRKTAPSPYGKKGEELTPKSKKRRTANSPNGNREEKRLRLFRKQPPKSYLEKLQRALEQRMFVIDRVRHSAEMEVIELAGSTGNVYHVTIGHLPCCTCPDNKQGNQCKHIVYVLHNVLKAPPELEYQLAFLSDELREIFANAPVSISSDSSATTADQNRPSNRKSIAGDCPICFMEFDAEAKEIVWCKAACGNNIHRGCFEKWAASQNGKEVKCVYCRTLWQGEEDLVARIKGKKGKVNKEGYVNFADELGLSGIRDYSSYHQPWVRRTLGYY